MTGASLIESTPLWQVLHQYEYEWYGMTWGYDGDWGMMAIVSAGGYKAGSEYKSRFNAAE